MKEDSINIKPKQNPVLLDKALQDIQKALIDKLPWLNYAFGRAYKLSMTLSEDYTLYAPAVYNNNGEYISVLPNDNFGNFSWFDIYDPQEVKNISPIKRHFSYNGAIVFWYDQSSIFDDASVLYTEDIKNEILEVLTTPGIISNGHLTVSSFYENFENIYRGYNIESLYTESNLDKQLFMYPYAGLRVEISLDIKNLCK